MVLPVLGAAPLVFDLGPQPSVFLWMCQSVVASIANALFWIYSGPKVADYVESRWPFERGHRRRLQTLHGRNNAASP